MFDAIQTLRTLQEGLTAAADHELGVAIPAQQSTMAAIEAPGVLDARTKLLVAIGAIAFARCENCVALHMPKVIAAGASRAEVMEAAAMAICFGGGPSMAFVGTVIGPAYDQFAAAIASGEVDPSGELFQGG